MTTPARLATRALLSVATVLIVALQFLDPGVGPLEKPMSSYALGAYANLWLVAVLAAGIAMVIESRRHDATRSTMASRILTGTGIAFIVLALFTTDPWYPWQHALTPRGWTHVIATGAGMGGLALSMTFHLVAVRHEGRTGRARVAAMVAAAYVILVTLIGLATLILVILGRDVPLIGLEERVLMVLGFLWLALES